MLRKRLACRAGCCQFGADVTIVPLIAKRRISHDVRVFTFGLPDRNRPLNLATCACILAVGAADGEGKPVVRPYTPVSTNAQVGSFDLMVKIYPGGIMSSFLDTLVLGDELGFKHVPMNVKLQYPVGRRRIGMIVGGTGITPMLQLLHAILGDVNGDGNVSVGMVLGNKTEADILARETLDAWCAMFPERLSVTHVLSREPAGSSWPGERGHIGRALIEALMPPSTDDTKIVVCGPPPMYLSLCGPRDKPELTGLLAEMGYVADQVYKF